MLGNLRECQGTSLPIVICSQAMSVSLDHIEFRRAFALISAQIQMRDDVPKLFDFEANKKMRATSR